MQKLPREIDRMQAASAAHEALSHMMSFEQWLISARPEHRAAARRWKGSERAAYDAIVAEFMEVAGVC